MAETSYHLSQTSKILLTSEAGAKISSQPNLTFVQGRAQGKVITVRPDIIKQNILGIGTSFTESSAFVLAHLSKEKRAEVMENIYGEGRYRVSPLLLKYKYASKYYIRHDISNSLGRYQ